MQDGPPPWLAGADITSSCSTVPQASPPSTARQRQRQHVSSIGGLRRHRAVPSCGAFKSAATAYQTPRASPPPRSPDADATSTPPTEPVTAP